MDWVQNKIHQAQMEGWKQLDLGNAGLQAIPSEVFRLEALEVLILADEYLDSQRDEWISSENQGSPNQIAEIPDEIADLTNLQALNLSFTQVSDLTPLQGLTKLSSLNLSNTRIRDLRPLQGLTALSSLNLWGTGVSDLTPLRGLTKLSSLDLSTTPVRDLRPLQGLTALSSLNLWGTGVSDLTPLRRLTALSSLNLNSTQVGDLTPLQELTRLSSLILINTPLRDLRALQGLTALSSLDLCYTQVSDLTPLQGLTKLSSLNLRGTQVSTFPDFILNLPHLDSLSLSGSPISNIPMEIFSNPVDNCLGAVRSHFADQAYGVKLDREIKLILLGNGRVGKTSVVKCLIGEDFNPSEPSTHGIQLVSWPLSDRGESIQINIWDFGGQDIYHGTHALFLRSRSLFLLVWDRFSERQPGYDENGLFFEHFPLAYWIDYVRETSPGSPVLVIENKCDDGKGSEAPTIVPGAHLPFSAKTGFGQEAVTGWIRDTSRRELENLGARAIGIGRWQVKQTLLDYQEQDESREPADRRYRTISYAHFQALCDTQGGRVSSARELLCYLHHTGVVYYQEGLFNNQIILDQRWAIEAIYIIFHRQKAYRQLKRLGGRFRPSDLHDLAWEEEGFTYEEQRLFITFMESCALCFRLSEWNEDDPEYLTPELLPVLQDHRDTRLELDARRQKHGDEVVYYRYTQPFLHQGVMRRFMVEIGRLFRDRALYWKDGLCIDPPQSQVMAIIECEHGIDGNPALGRITLEARGRQRHALMNRIRNTFEPLVAHPETLAQTISLDGGKNWVDVADLEKARLIRKVLSQQGQVLEVREFLFLFSKESGDDLSQDAPYAPEETVMPPSMPAIYVSYAWGDSQETDVSREDIVDRLYEALIHEGYNVKRDKKDLSYKGLISEFMQAIGHSDCIVVVISDKYLKSPFCMYELLEIYRNLQFDDRVCPIVLADAKLRSLADRLEYIAHWKEEEARLKGLIDKVGWEVLSASGSLQEYKKYRQITFHADNLLTHLADINSQTPEHIAADNFDMLKHAIDARLRQLQSH